MLINENLWEIFRHFKSPTLDIDKNTFFANEWHQFHNALNVLSDTQSKISESCKKGQPLSPNCTCKSGNTLILSVKTESMQNKRFSKRFEEDFKDLISFFMDFYVLLT